MSANQLLIQTSITCKVDNYIIVIKLIDSSNLET
jgi:hypothetical protein